MAARVAGDPRDLREPTDSTDNYPSLQQDPAMISTSLHLYSEFRLTEEALKELDTSVFEEFVKHTRDEPGCNRADLYRRDDAEDVFMLIAEFENQEALEAHLNADWRHERISNMRTMLEGGLRRFTMQQIT